MPAIILLLAEDEGFLLEGEFALLGLGIVGEELVEILEGRVEVVGLLISHGALGQGGGDFLIQRIILEEAGESGDGLVGLMGLHVTPAELEKGVRAIRGMRVAESWSEA